VDPVNVGIVGCGNISPIYIENLSNFPATRVVAVADLDPNRARERASAYGIPRAGAPGVVLDDPDIAVVVNLTVPKAHAEVAFQALNAGKHVYNEKPLAVSRADGADMLRIAGEHNLRVGAAPDTFLGAGIQTCRELIDQGAIGTPVAGHASMLCHGHESWHPSPEFYYEIGGGPLFDMGPYYLTALVALLGPIRRVAGATAVTFPTRTITSEPKKGRTIAVETPTHLAAVLDFAAGPIVQLTTSFDIWGHTQPCIEIYGSEGSLSVPDPNGFGGPVRLCRAGGEWHEVGLDRAYAQNSRGLGVLDMVLAEAEGRPHRASGGLAFHVLDVMHAVGESSDQGRHIDIHSGFEAPAPLPKEGLSA